MPLFKKKDKTAAAVQSQPQAQSQSFGPPPPSQSLGHHADGRPDLRAEESNSTFNTAPSARDSNLSSADTRVNQSTDSQGNRQTVVTTTTTTTVTTVTSDGRVFTEQHENSRPVGELSANPEPRPRSQDHQAPQTPVQDNHASQRYVDSLPAPVQQSSTTTTTTPPPNIPSKHARRTSREVDPSTIPNTSSMEPLPPPPQIPYQTGYDSAPAQPASPNFSRPGTAHHRRNDVKQAAIGIHGIGEGLRGAINYKAGELLHDDPATLAKNREIRDQGLREAKGSSLLQRIPVGQGRRNGNYGNGNVDERSRNF